MNKIKIYVAGHRGMVGSALIKLLQKKSNVSIITRKKAELDLTNQKAVLNFFKKKKIDQVYLAAAKVGGIYANDNFPGEFIYENIMIQTNVINAAFKTGVKKLLFLGSSCIYPRNANQPMKEQELLTGILEKTNEPYAVAKISGIKMCESYNRQYGKDKGVDFRSVMPTNLYGPGDRYHSKNSHVIPGLILRFHEAKINKIPNVKVWGTGKPKREFLYVDDMARACIHVMNLNKKIYEKKSNLMCSHINIGTGKDLTIKEVAKIIKDVVGYKGKIIFDPSKPDGSPRKLLRINRIISLGWKPKTNLRDGLIKTYRAFLKN
jgi:GDP-L-fucose synthase